MEIRSSLKKFTKIQRSKRGVVCRMQIKFLSETYLFRPCFNVARLLAKCITHHGKADTKQEDYEQIANAISWS